MERRFKSFGLHWAAFWSSSDVLIRHWLIVSQVPNLSCVTLNTIKNFVPMEVVYLTTMGLLRVKISNKMVSLEDG